MEDITLRALRVLAQVDIIACEDTRQTRKLVTFHQIKNSSLVALHEHNEKAKARLLTQELRNGQSVALVSDAGTPTVSDPGYALVGAAVAAGISVIPIPGASALLTALSAGGLPTDEFVFIGFPAKKKGARTVQLRELARERRTLVFYQSPRRMTAFVAELNEILGDRRAVLGREMTKLYEEFIRGRLSQIVAQLETKAMVKGECTLLVEGRKQTPSVSEKTLKAQIVRHLKSGFESPSDLAKRLAREHALPKRRIYQLILECKAIIPDLDDE
jgi:16S rRNA (cytidine1402-2'-O)-methyltransferase